METILYMTEKERAGITGDEKNGGESESELNALLDAVHEGKCLTTWDGNESGVLWERLWKWSKEEGYQAKTCCSDFFDPWHTYSNKEQFLKSLNKQINEFKFNGI